MLVLNGEILTGMAAGRAKYFILCVGAQKAGTSWLHKQLCKSQNFAQGFAKEYHTFDSLYSPVCSNMRNRLLRSTRLAINRMDDRAGQGSPLSQHAKRLSFIESTDNYFEYFDYLWLTNSLITSTGDVTPSYSTLDAKAFAVIREGLLKKGFTPRVVFLMRDPIERIWSMLRMEWRNRKKVVGFDEAMKRLLACHRNPGVQLRTQYDRTIIELEKVFPANELCYGFYENLFSLHGFKGIMQFTGLDLQAPDFMESINSSPKGEDTEPDAQVAAEIVKTYGSVYTFILSRFGEQMLDLWHGYRYLLTP